MRLAFVTPRYGAEISGGPEHACRLLAEQVCMRHDVDVITTCSSDTTTWKNERSEGADRIRGVLVRRFSTAATYDERAVQQLAERIFRGGHSRADELEWVRRRGPWSPGLIEFLKRHNRNYDALVFFSHQHATTVHGLGVAPGRSILFPWLTPDATLRLELTRDALRTATAIGYVSSAERRLARLHVHNGQQEELVGIGVQTPPDQQRYPRIQEDPEGATENAEDDAEPEEDHSRTYLGGRGVPFRRRHRLEGRFVLHAGRFEPDNGTEELIEYFDTYASQDGDMSLVLLGVKMMKVPEERYLRPAGILPPRERFAAFEAAEVTAAPEPHDLLVEPVLESLSVGTPVLASARNAAAVEHCRRSNGGLYYANREEFAAALRLLTTNDRMRDALGRNGRSYVRQHYRWDAVMGRFEGLLTRVRGR